MAIKIAWKTLPELSPLYAAAAVCNGRRIAEPKLSESILPMATTVSDRLAVAEIDVELFWAHLIAQASRGKHSASHVEPALVAAGSGELAADSIAPTIAGPIADLRIAFFDTLPQLSQQLPLRINPLREQWESRGPGLMAAIGRLSHPSLLPSKATIAPVHPATGGGGATHVPAGLLWIEAVLANPNQDVPEIVRLAWLLARLGLGHSEASKLIAAEHLPEVAAMALLPIVIEAAREVEMLESTTVTRLFEAWNIRSQRTRTSPDDLTDWWDQTRGSEQPFPVRLKALDQVLCPA